jgi:hypothetical protein
MEAFVIAIFLTMGAICVMAFLDGTIKTIIRHLKDKD